MANAPAPKPVDAGGNTDRQGEQEKREARAEPRVQQQPNHQGEKDSHRRQQQRAGDGRQHRNTTPQAKKPVGPGLIGEFTNPHSGAKPGKVIECWRNF